MSSFSPLGVTFGDRLSADLTDYEDFRKHRKMLNKNTVRLRRDLKMITGDTQNYSEKEQTSKISAESYDADPRHALLLLLLAERDIVYALQIKSLFEVSGQRMASYRKLMVGRMKRAVTTSRKMLSVVAHEKDAALKVEFYVYAALADGVYSINKKSWSKAIYSLSVARCGLEFLRGQTRTDGSDQRFNSVLVDDLLGSLVDPSLSMALSSNSSNDKTSDLKTISRKYAQENTVPWLAEAVEVIQSQDADFFESVGDSAPNHITWRHHEARLYNNELAQKIKDLQQAEQDGKLFLNEQWSELVDVHMADLANMDDDDAEKTQDGAIVLTFLKYNMLFWQLWSHFKAMTTSNMRQSFSDISRTVGEISDLPGVYNDEELSRELEILSTYIAAEKADKMAQIYTGACRFPEALKLYVHANKMLSSVNGAHMKLPIPPFQDEEFKKVRARAPYMITYLHAVLQVEKDAQRPGTVVENIDTFLPGNNIHNITDVDQRGLIKPVLSKPVLFDVAFNYIGYSDGVEQTRAVEQREQREQPEQKKGGFFGIFGRS